MTGRLQLPEVMLNVPKNQHIRGRYSSLAISTLAGLAVSVMDDSFGSLYCCAGQYDRNQNKILWGEKREDYGSGRHPCICLIYKEETLYVIELHCNYWFSSVECKMGKIDPASLSITWNKDGAVFSGKKPKLCGTENGVVIAIYETNPLFGTLAYRVANTTIQDENIDISWSDEKRLSSITGVEPDIAVCQDKLVAICRTGKVYQVLSAIVGTLKDNVVTWHRRVSKCGVGHNPSISINSGHIVTIFQVTGRKLCPKSGILINDAIHWNNNSNSTFTYGEYPSVVLTDDKKIVEMHKTNFGNSMFQCEGKLEDTTE